MQLRIGLTFISAHHLAHLSPQSGFYVLIFELIYEPTALVFLFCLASDVSNLLKSTAPASVGMTDIELGFALGAKLVGN